MAIKRPKPDEIVITLRQVEVLMGQGMPQNDAIRQIRITWGKIMLRFIMGFAAAFIVLAMIAVGFMLGFYSDTRSPSKLVEFARKTLSNEQRPFLETSRAEVRVIAKVDMRSWLLGADETIAKGDVTVRIGIDLGSVKVETDGGDPDGVIVWLPNLTVLSVTLDETSVQYSRQATVFQRLVDIEGTDQHSLARQELKKDAVAFVHQERLFPDRSILEEQIRSIMHGAGFNGGLIFRDLTDQDAPVHPMT